MKIFKKLISILLAMQVMASCVSSVAYRIKIVRRHNDTIDKDGMNITMASDNNYVLPLIVAVTSILENRNSDTKINFYFLVSKDFNKKNVQLLLNLKSKYKNFNINIVNMGDSFKEARTRLHITTPAFYRLRLASLLKDLDKCLHLDVDTIVNIDLKELYNTDITDFYIAGVKDMGAQSWGDKYASLLEIKDMSQYINTGVLLINLKKIREDNLEKKFNEFIPNLATKKELHCHDQDVLNAVCYNKIYFLPFKYNVMTHFNVLSEKAWCGMAQKCYTKKEWTEAITNPQIIHYAGHKPWKKFSVRLNRYWWSYAMKTEVVEEIDNLFTKHLTL